jgi:hypothetical protein
MSNVLTVSLQATITFGSLGFRPKFQLGHACRGDRRSVRLHMRAVDPEITSRPGAKAMTFLVSTCKIEVLAAGTHGGVGYESSVGMDNDAPPLANLLSNVHSGRIISRTLSRKLTARYRLRPSCRHLFIIDVEKRARFFGVNTLERLKQKSVANWGMGPVANWYITKAANPRTMTG